MPPPASFQSFRLLALCAAGLTLAVAPPSAKADPVASSAALGPHASALTGKWRTNGTFRLYVNGTLGMGGDAPTWLTFKSDGSIIADGDSWLVGWKNSGGRPQLSLNTKVVRRELGEPSSVHYARKSPTVTGKSIHGNFDCTFSVLGRKVRFVWKFSGRR